MANVINLLLKSNYQNAVRFYIPCTFWVSVIKGLENVSFGPRLILFIYNNVCISNMGLKTILHYGQFLTLYICEYIDNY